MKKNWFRILSPCILVFILLVVYTIGLLIWQYKTQGWSLLAAGTLLPFAVFVIIIDVIVKIIFPKHTGRVWISEIVLLFLSYFLWVSFIRGDFF